MAAGPRLAAICLIHAGQDEAVECPDVTVER
jgi:hypothetical protein